MADTFWNLSWPPWPQGAVLFALGVHASERGRLVTLSPRRTRRHGKVAATALAALVALASYGTYLLHRLALVVLSLLERAHPGAGVTL